ncbi:MFS transporter [Labrys sp. LIt4]|uniref:MFS transporter n=1 Tax=Labrys sp. LIt4 TaxID=2821355 RepID=UPI001ADF3853|nr:MFS transporter [Labrys sp. LIt4]MBP0582861.1 MFS transporter [Labrys sp. LIt4]
MSLISFKDWSVSRKSAIAASVTYALLLSGPGVYTPFFPLWLVERGFNASDMGLLLAIPMLMRVTSAPFAWIGDGRLGPRRTFLFMVCCAAFGYAGLTFAESFAAVAVNLAIAFAFVAATTPLLDTIVLGGVSLHGHKYGQIRQWGSLAWLVSGLTAGLVLKHLPITTVPPILAILAALTVFAGLSLPDDRSRGRRLIMRPASEGTSPPLQLLIVFVAGIACLQGAHAFLYSFGTLIWQDQGFSSLQIGVLWAIGVVLETSVFLFGGNIAGRLGPYRLILFGGAVGIARWVLLGLAPGNGFVVAGLQALHGFSFACVHLATMGWVARFTRNPSARQGVVASVIGIGLTLGTVLSGELYGLFSAHGYFAMALIAMIGTGLVVAAGAIERRNGAQPQSAVSGG